MSLLDDNPALQARLEKLNPEQTNRFNDNPTLQARLDKLNPEQRQAVDTLDGSVLVVAGPGTGKTELLSLRVAQILRERDVQAKNILCLTYTDAGTQAMQKRLASLIGADAYQTDISTFHAFAVKLATQYPEYFVRPASDQLLSNLARSILINQLLRELPVSDPLFQQAQDGRVGNLSQVDSFITSFNRSGLRPNELRMIVEQNLAAIDYLESDARLMSLIETKLPRSAEQKAAFISELDDCIQQLAFHAAQQLTQPLTSLPGIYEPFINYFCRLFTETELIKETGSTSGFQELRKQFFSPDENRQQRIRQRETNNKLLSAITVYERYRQALKDSHRYDYDDMILDAITAIEANPAFKYRLQELYLYILVDEFQDTNGSQMRLLDLLCDYSKRPNILAVGDDDQAIMRFQGASVRHLIQFEQHFQDIQRIVLKTNYRSLPSLVQLGQKLASQISNRLPASETEKMLISAHTESSPQEFVALQYANPDIQCYELARAIRQRIDDGYITASEQPDEAIAVIASRHASLRRLIPYLNALDIAFNYRITSTVGQLPALVSLLACMRVLAALARGSAAILESQLPTILAAPEFGLTAEQYIGFALERRTNRTSWLEGIRDAADPVIAAFYPWLLGLAQRAQTSPVRELLSDLAAPMQVYYQRQSDKQSLIEFNYGLQALLDFVKEELANASNLAVGPHQPLRLADIVDRLDQAERFAVDINVDMALSRPQAITLTSAHSAKGLQYDLVYLLDSDDNSWHTRARGGTLIPDNLLFGQQRDEDDARRLLFVAATRARYELGFYLGRPALTRELIDLVNIQSVEPDLDALVQQSTTSLSERYFPHDMQLTSLTQPYLERLRMSATLLNSFLDRALVDQSMQDFFSESILRLPVKPSAASEFGNLVHGFFEDWLNRVVRAQDTEPRDLLIHYQQLIEWLDFEPVELDQMRQRLDLIARQFLPIATGLFVVEARAEQWGSARIGEVPLTGKFDLLVPDHQRRELVVYDFKTGRPDDKGQLSASQWRQLLFYKLLLEASPEYSGWTVVGAADLFVDPSRIPSGQVQIPVPIKLDGVDLSDFSLLVKAVWQRIQTNDYDVSAFAHSELMAELKAKSVYKTAGTGHQVGDPKEPSKSEIQPIFERWLIDEYLKKQDS